MAITPEKTIDGLEVHATRLSPRNLVRSFLNSPIGGPWPRIGTLRGDGRVLVPHFFGRKPTIEENVTRDQVLGTGTRVIVYTHGEIPPDELAD